MPEKKLISCKNKSISQVNIDTRLLSCAHRLIFSANSILGKIFTTLCQQVSKVWNLAYAWLLSWAHKISCANKLPSYANKIITCAKKFIEFTREGVNILCKLVNARFWYLVPSQYHMRTIQYIVQSCETRLLPQAGKNILGEWVILCQEISCENKVIILDEHKIVLCVKVDVCVQVHI